MRFFRFCAFRIKPDAVSLLLGVLIMMAGIPVKATEVPMVKEGGVFTVPVRINDVLTLHFILDSGAAEVQIPADVALTLLRTGTIREGDFLPGSTYRMADGSRVKSARFVLRKLQIGNLAVQNVSASLGSVEGPLLLGQSLLSRLPTWSLDNRRQVLILSDSGVNPPAPPPQQPAKPAGASSGWMAAWENDVRAIGRKLECPVGEFADQGYKYAFVIDIPAARLKTPAEAWTQANGRAVTIMGCWFKNTQGLAHAKLRRKKDGKTWEQDFNFADGTWRELR